MGQDTGVLLTSNKYLVTVHVKALLRLISVLNEFYFEVTLEILITQTNEK